MNTLNYFIEANIGVVVFYAMYRLLLGSETDFKVQRAYLLAGLVGAVFLPFVRITMSANATVTTFTRVLPELVLTPSGAAESETTSHIWSVANYGLFIYFTGMAIILLPMMIQGYRLFKVYRHSQKIKDGNYFIVDSPVESSSYSFFNIVVIGQGATLNVAERDMIIMHEKGHARLLHSIDVLLMTLLVILFWFNPFIWLYRRTVLRIHEYQVDDLVAGESSASEYSVLLAKAALIRNGFFLTHPFNQSFILKRINMINKMKNPASRWKLVTLAAVALCFTIVIACTDQVSESAADMPEEVKLRLAELTKLNPGSSFEAFKVEDKDIASLWSEPAQTLEYLTTSSEAGNWVIVNRKPSTREVFEIVEESGHPLENMTMFYEEIAAVLDYPEQARREGVEGRVFVGFVVEADGRLTDFKVLRGIGAGCDAAAVRAVMQTKLWQPGTNGGIPVAQRVVLPIVFKLN